MYVYLINFLFFNFWDWEREFFVQYYVNMIINVLHFVSFLLSSRADLYFL